MMLLGLKWGMVENTHYLNSKVYTQTGVTRQKKIHIETKISYRYII